MNPFILNSISVVSNMWFAENELARSTAISGLMAPLGSLLGLAVAGVFSSGVDTEDPVDCYNRLKNIVYAQNAFYTVTCVLLLIFFREKPTEPPSKLSLTFKKLSQYGILEDMKTLIKNRNFLYCMLCFTIVWGSYMSLGNVLTPMFSKQFKPAEISIIGIIFVITGVIGCYLMGVFIDKKQKHLVAIRFIVIGMVVLYGGSMFLIPIGDLAVTGALAIFLGVFNVPILPSSYSYATKLVGQMPPAVVNGLMMSGAQTYTFLASLILTYLLGQDQLYGLAFFTGSFLVAMMFTLCINEKKGARYAALSG